MDKEIVVSITLYGEVECKNNCIDWYEYCKRVIERLGHKPNYISIESDSIKSNKVLSLDKNERKVIKSINNDTNIKWLSVYSLPNDFITASFDYNILFTRNNKYLSIIMNKKLYSKLDVDSTLSELRKFIKLKHGEIYEMHRDESPLLYASGLNEASDFDTLKIIKKL
ncbi:hypothetical protein [Clostridium sp. ZBS2]|uniref:hypothetical protein n=1 Tax=Clostridium sp. ZBS2 TaxID=2949976 RepID=UPI00207ABF99|nr:hypothetical protein [Clostridium sp. ZBS2]